MKRRDSPALLAARNKNWSKFAVMGAIANLQKLTFDSIEITMHISAALRHLKAAVKEMS